MRILAPRRDVVECHLPTVCFTISDSCRKNNRKRGKARLTGLPLPLRLGRRLLLAFLFGALGSGCRVGFRLQFSLPFLEGRLVRSEDVPDRVSPMTQSQPLVSRWWRCFAIERPDDVVEIHNSSPTCPNHSTQPRELVVSRGFEVPAQAG